MNHSKSKKRSVSSRSIFDRSYPTAQSLANIYGNEKVNQPQVQNTSSKQSLSASEGYNSVSEHASSGENSSQSQQTVIPYTTPPSRNQHHDQLRSRSTLPLSPIIDRSSSPTLPSPPALVLHFPTDDRSITPEVFPSPPPALDLTNSQSMEGEMNSPTPGVDDTPYIRFAIEQLTRDEEVRGSRQYTTVNRPERYSYERERVVSNESLGYVIPEQRQSYVSHTEERFEEEQQQPEERSYCELLLSIRVNIRLFLLSS